MPFFVRDLFVSLFLMALLSLPLHLSFCSQRRLSPARAGWRNVLSGCWGRRLGMAAAAVAGGGPAARRLSRRLDMIQCHSQPSALLQSHKPSPAGLARALAWNLQREASQRRRRAAQAGCLSEKMAGERRRCGGWNVLGGACGSKRAQVSERKMIDSAVCGSAAARDTPFWLSQINCRRTPQGKGSAFNRWLLV